MRARSYKYSYFVSILILVVVVLNYYFGISFPVPWIDESYFMLQSLAFSETNTLFTESLIPNRNVMWMPPGYLLLVGFFFKWFHFSLYSAREISLFFYCVSILLYFKLFCDKKSNLNFLIVAIIFLIPSSLVASNVARMESLVLALGIASLLATNAARFQLAISLVLLGTLFHPNSLYFSLPIIAGLWFERGEFRRLLQKTKTQDWLMLICTLSLVAAYILYVLINIEGFKVDMALQIARKLTKKPFYTDLRALFFLSITILFVLVFSWRNNKKQAIFACFALSGILIFANGQEMWYQIYRNIGIGTLILILIGEVRPAIWKLTSVFILMAGYVASAGIGFAGMSPAILEGGYLEQKTIINLQHYLLKLKDKNKGRLSVAFNTTGGDLIFLNFLKSNDIKLIRWMPVEMTPPRPVDLCIYISVAQDPLWLRESMLLDLPEPKLCRYGLVIIYARDQFITLDPSEHSTLAQDLRGL